MTGRDVIRRNRQAVRHGILVPISTGSNPVSSASGSALASVDKNGPSMVDGVQALDVNRKPSLKPNRDCRLARGGRHTNYPTEKVVLMATTKTIIVTNRRRFGIYGTVAELFFPVDAR